MPTLDLFCERSRSLTSLLVKGLWLRPPARIAARLTASTRRARIRAGHVPVDASRSDCVTVVQEWNPRLPFVRARTTGHDVVLRAIAARYGNARITPSSRALFLLERITAHSQELLHAAGAAV